MLAYQPQRQVVSLPAHWFDNTWQALSLWPESQPLVFLGGPRSDLSLLALSWDERPFSEFLAEPMALSSESMGKCLGTGQLALLSYDHFDPGAVASKAMSRVLRIRRSLCLDHSQREAYIYTEPGWENCATQLPWPPPDAAQPLREQTDPVRWTSLWSDEDYKSAVEGVVDEIRSGRYYQLNLLRYWQTKSLPNRWHWLKQLSSAAGPFAAYIALPDLNLVSFSPERLVETGRTGMQSWIEAAPIKGTRPVSQDVETDKKWQSELMSSRKDEAELNMIVDLLRNDLQKISLPASVKVLDPGSLHSFFNVHHRIARIRGQLRPGTMLQDALSALCPGGSITGAPKREVMQAIREKEQRNRAFFMGNILFKDRITGRLDSSILIRTAVKQGDGPWEFAAGSGLVIQSEAEEELQEILAKARVLGAEFNDAWQP